MRIILSFLRQNRTVSLLGLALMLAMQIAFTAPAIYAQNPIGPLCGGLLCNDPSDCGSLCFCNNPYDTVGTCVPDM